MTIQLPRDREARNLAPWAFAFECGLAVLAAAIGWLIQQSPFRTLEQPAHHWSRQLLFGLAAAMPPFLALIGLQRVSWNWVRELHSKLAADVLPYFRDARAYELVAVSLAAGFAEELLFRGLLQDAIQQWRPDRWGTGLAIVIASASFGALHALTRAYAVLATVMGVYLGLLFWWSDSLIAAAVAHGIYDALAFFWLLKRKVHDSPP